MRLAFAAALTLLHRPLAALMETRAARAAVWFLGSRLMTVYLWHLPVIMVLTGVQLLLPLPLPEPGSAIWWATRIPMLLLVLAGLLWLVVSGMGDGLSLALFGTRGSWSNAAIQAVVSTVLGVFPAVGAAAVYHEARTAKEGAGDHDLAAVFA